MPATRSTGKGRNSASRTGPSVKKVGDGQPHGKRVTFDAETWQAVDLLARDSMKDFQDLADEAFRDLLRKHGRPSDLKTALRRSAAPSKPLNTKQTGRWP